MKTKINQDKEKEELMELEGVCAYSAIENDSNSVNIIIVGFSESHFISENSVTYISGDTKYVTNYVHRRYNSVKEIKSLEISNIKFV